MYDQTNHRKRVRERFRAESLDDFSPVHALELLLFYAIPQKDTKTLARDLLNHFGTFHGVLEASPEQLQQIPGVGENTALYLNLIREAGRYYQVDRGRQTETINSLEECGEYLRSYFSGRTNECIYALCLDSKGKILCCRKLAEGDKISSYLPPRRVVELALTMQASVVVLAHNHPGGYAVPSEEDLHLTDRLRELLENVNIRLMDHVIVTENEHISLAMSKQLRMYVSR